MTVSRFKSQFGVDVALHVELLRSSRITFEPTYLYCSDFAGGAQCMLESPVVFECSRGSHSKADRACRRRHIRGVCRTPVYKLPSQLNRLSRFVRSPVLPREKL